MSIAQLQHMIETTGAAKQDPFFPRDWGMPSSEKDGPGKTSTRDFAASSRSWSLREGVARLLRKYSAREIAREAEKQEAFDDKPLWQRIFSL